MPAVNNVLVVGAGLAGAGIAIHLAGKGVAVDLARDQAGGGRPRLGHHPAGQRAARAQVARRLGPGAGGRLRLRHHGHPRARPERHRRRRDRRRQDRRPRPARRHGHAAPRAGPHPDGPRDRGRRQGPARHHLHRAGAGRRRRRRHLRRRLHRPVRPRHRGRRAALLDPSRARHQPGDQVGRHGHLAGLRPAAGQRHPHRPVLRRPVLHRRLLPHRRELPLRLHRRGRAGPQRAVPRGAARHDEAALARPTTARGTRSARRSPTRPASTTRGSRRTSSTCRGTAAGSC